MASRTILALAAFFFKSGMSEVHITDVNYSTTFLTFHSMAASFGQPISSGGIHGVAFEAVPSYACGPIEPPPHLDLMNTSWIAVISRYGDCSFEDKVRNAMKANFSAVIVYNVDSNKVIPMGGQDDDLIPSVFVGYSSGIEILRHFTYAKNPNIRVVLTDEEPFDINAYLLPFAIVVGICFLVMLAIVIFKCIQDYRRRMRHRLPKSALKKLPIHKFKPGDPFETCCICLDDFEENDKLRILPCDHGYHAKCIDPWLVKNKRICPQCRKRVFDRGSGYSGDSDSDHEQHNERRPLLAAQPRSGGTFGDRPSSMAAIDRLRSTASQFGTPSTSQSDHFATMSESARGVLPSNLCSRSRRLRRVYEVLDDDDESSSDDEPQMHQNQPEDRSHQPPLLTAAAQPASQCDFQQHVAAEVHVHSAGSQPNKTDDNEEDEESPIEVSIYREHGSSTSEEEDDDEEPKVVVTTPSSSTSPPHQENA